MTAKKFCFKTESSQLYPPFIHSRTFYSIYTPVACSTPGNYTWYMRNHVRIPLSLHILNQLKRLSWVQIPNSISLHILNQLKRLSWVQIPNSILRNKKHFESQRKQISRSKMVPFNSHGKSVQVFFIFLKQDWFVLKTIPSKTTQPELRLSSRIPIRKTMCKIKESLWWAIALSHRSAGKLVYCSKSWRVLKLQFNLA
jgi:hypothetical protein